MTNKCNNSSNGNYSNTLTTNVFSTTSHTGISDDTVYDDLIILHWIGN